MGWVLKYIEDAAFWQPFRDGQVNTKVKWEKINVAKGLTAFKLTNLKEITVYRLRWLHTGDKDAGTRDKDIKVKTLGKENQLQ